jgi:NAD(P)-dependent dehydrogenase (short-subunit alcohol dehydrogenase family)
MTSPSQPLVRRDFMAKSHATSYPYISPLEQNLAGRHVLITGAGFEDGVGYATATAFARAGASVIAITDLRGISDDLVSRLKFVAFEARRPAPHVISGRVDISRWESVVDFKENFSKAFKDRLDILVNNAAYQEPYKSILDSDPESYWKRRSVLDFRVQIGLFLFILF